MISNNIGPRSIFCCSQSTLTCIDMLGDCAIMLCNSGAVDELSSRPSNKWASKFVFTGSPLFSLLWELFCGLHRILYQLWPCQSTGYGCSAWYACSVVTGVKDNSLVKQLTDDQGSDKYYRLM